ncbi:MAG: insulinase family protein [Gammaproteobacteria bacterium]|nr:insulinase family protein [Gammaproteobacteria bacterium]MDH3750531.1 insulinase family protein [Gammaproteobacteria bacterium]MDH3804741.1 insulinase family protein [Gammaproteobacteria bacterium]
MQLTKVSMWMVGLVLALSGCQSGDHHGTADDATPLPQGIVLLESVESADASGIVIPYKKFRLENGLTVILHEDLSDPLVHVDVTYHVGSGREEIGKSGFAHFFEHMMFQGSENVGDEQHFKIVSEAGGTLNGSTSYDRTNYFQTVPANQLEKMLWLEADRMGFFLDAVTQEKFEVQRDTVKNERGQNYENRPYGRLIERVNEALYPEGHPYSWQPIGYVEDLNRVDVNDLKKFFLRWYGPNNAALTIGGRFDEAEALAWVIKYFGPIPKGPEVDNPEKPVVTLDADRYLSMEDNVALPLLYMSYPTVHLYHEDEAPLDVLMFILGKGETSLLYKNMVKNGFAVQAAANHACAELSCTFTVLALPNPASGNTLADLERIARESLAEFEERGVVEDDLARVKMNIVSGMIYNLESVAGKVTQLAMYETYTGNPNFTAEDIARYENVTEDDVMRVYRQYVKDEPAVVMSIVPRGQTSMVAKRDTWSRYDRQLPDYESISEGDLAFRPAKDEFDRSVMPPSGDNPSVILPEIWRVELDNGIEVLGAMNSETPTAAIQLRIEAGQRNEPLDKLGLAALTAGMLNESTVARTNEVLSNELQKLGASVQFSAGNDDTTLTIRTLTESLDATLDIAAERLLQPAFDAEDFARRKDQTLQAIRQSKTQAAATAATVYQLLLFGNDNSFSYLNIGTEESVSALTLDDVKAFYKDHYSPKISSIVAVSDQPRATLVEKLKVFEGWQGPDVAEVALNEFPNVGETKIYLVDKPGAAQSEIRIGKQSLNYDATGEYYRAYLMNFPLGGAFNSRINLNLREDKGYTYGARSGFSGTEDFGTYTAQAGVRTDATADSIVQFEDEIRNYAESGISEPELTFTRRAIGQRDARSYETPSQKLGFLSQILVYDLEDDFVDVQNEILAAIGQDELNQLAAKHLNMDEMIIVVVGDKQVILPQLEKLGYEIVELDAAGNEVSD